MFDSKAWAKFARDIWFIEVTLCWEWVGDRRDRYGNFRYQGKSTAAHRWSYETFVGSIPEGLELDHTCENRLCVNPHHLEPVTHLENMQRHFRPIQERTHCKRGHPWAGNTFYNKNSHNRRCRACDRLRRSKG